ncbi:DUF6838 family protein [Paenibacillus sp. L3-i20]|uniref:phage tail terminator family protein n=1 Tax=Paenibacillus sp. L3-i20 TaxID=2905833 RepID=UPI001EDCD5F7|nr:hypothetical protein [Paenibacillus sp. L3-i20]GKU75661.1 hypothetical protein L3i20_v200580 [Paenibacillus sp. L3-i20]
MNEVTINEIRSALHGALAAAFPHITIHSEGINQQLNPPYFLIKLLRSSHQQELGRRYRRKFPFDVQYISLAGNAAEMYQMAEHLTSALQTINVLGRSVPAIGMQFELIDGVLHFFVDFQLLIWAKSPTIPLMKTQNLEEGIIYD